MKHDEEVIAEASRIEVDESNGRLFIVFEVINEKHKNIIKQNWTEDVEYRLVGKNLVLNEK